MQHNEHDSVAEDRDRMCRRARRLFYLVNGKRGLEANGTTYIDNLLLLLIIVFHDQIITCNKDLH